MPRTRADVRATRFPPLSEDALERLLKAFQRRFERLDELYLRLMGEHIKDIGEMIPSDIHRLSQIRRMNNNLKRLERMIAEAADASVEDVETILRRCAETDARAASEILDLPDVVRVKDNPPLQRILEAQLRETAGAMRNLSNTTVVSDHYKAVVDEACQAVQTGVEDYNKAIRRVVREAGARGLRVRDNGTTVVDYESGWSRRLDSAVRMNVLDGVRHMNQDIMDSIGEEFGANGIELDAHMLCAEDHLPYQGRQYSKEDFEVIQNSLRRPFGEWNCRHSWHPIILGISQPAFSSADLERMRQNSEEIIEIEGKRKTRYEWTQEQRRVETAIREQKDTANLARASGDDELRKRCQGNIHRLNAYYARVSRESGVKAEYTRQHVEGFVDAKQEKQR